MISLYELLQFKRDRIYQIAEHYGVTHIRVFGSVSHRKETEQSDIDLLVEIDPERSLLDLALFSNELEDELGRRVDLVTEPALHPLLRTQILRDAVPL